MLGFYRLKQPILALFESDGSHQSATVPAGTVVYLGGKKFNGDRLMEVTWDGRTVMMFTEDLRTGTTPE